MTKEHPALALLTTLIEDAKVSQTKGVRTNTNRGNINTKFATIL